MSIINGNISVKGEFGNKNPIITKCALTVIVAISWLTTSYSPLIPKILSQTNACAHTAVSALTADPPHIRHYISIHLPYRAVGIILPCLYRPDK